MEAIKDCPVKMDMTLEQATSIAKCFESVEELNKKVLDLTLQLAEAKEDLRIISKSIYISADRSMVFINSFDRLIPQEQENFIFAVKRNQIKEMTQ